MTSTRFVCLFVILGSAILAAQKGAPPALAAVALPLHRSAERRNPGQPFVA